MFNKISENDKLKLAILDTKLKECKDNITMFNKVGDYDLIDIEIKKFETLVAERDKIKRLTISERAQVKMVIGLMQVFKNRNKRIDKRIADEQAKRDKNKYLD